MNKELQNWEKIVNELEEKQEKGILSLDKTEKEELDKLSKNLKKILETTKLINKAINTSLGVAVAGSVFASIAVTLAPAIMGTAGISALVGLALKISNKSKINNYKKEFEEEAEILIKLRKS